MTDQEQVWQQAAVNLAIASEALEGCSLEDWQRVCADHQVDGPLQVRFDAFRVDGRARIDQGAPIPHDSPAATQIAAGLICVRATLFTTDRTDGSPRATRHHWCPTLTRECASSSALLKLAGVLWTHELAERFRRSTDGSRPHDPHAGDRA